MTVDRDDTDQAVRPFGLFYTWWRGDVLPQLPRRLGLEIEPVAPDHLIAAVPGIDAQDAQIRFEQHHRPYLARLNGDAVGYGWSAEATASIGELGITLTMPPGNRYLWDFVTLPQWRGQGIYPRILQQIIMRDANAKRFWIGHDRPNIASARGILRAGFHLTGELYDLPDGYHLAPVGPRERAEAAAVLLNVPLLGHDSGSRA